MHPRIVEVALAGGFPFNSGLDRVRTLEFWFENGTTETFTLEEWRLFARFYNQILPTAFPNATLSIAPSDHPARFTDKRILEEVIKTIDIDIPEKYLPTHSQ